MQFSDDLADVECCLLASLAPSFSARTSSIEPSLQSSSLLLLLLLLLSLLLLLLLLQQTTFTACYVQSKASSVAKVSPLNSIADHHRKMQSRDVNRRSRSPTGESKRATRQRSQSPDHHDEPSLSGSEVNPEESRDLIKDHTERLHIHLGLVESSGTPPSKSGLIPLFFIENTPWSSRGGARYKLPGYTDLVQARTYRVA